MAHDDTKAATGRENAWKIQGHSVQSYESYINNDFTAQLCESFAPISYVRPAKRQTQIQGLNALGDGLKKTVQATQRAKWLND